MAQQPRFIEDHIRKNKLDTLVICLFMVILLFSVIFAVGYLVGAPPILTMMLALPLAVFYILITYSFSVQSVISAAGARPANPQNREEKMLIYKVEEMSLAAGLPMPKVYVQDSRDINAFATGHKPEDSIICATTGALQQLNTQELEGVIGHEMSHIRNRDILVIHVMSRQNYSYFWRLLVPVYQLDRLYFANVPTSVQPLILGSTMLAIHVAATYLTFWALWTLSLELFNSVVTALLTVLAFVIPHIGFARFPVMEFSLLNRTFALPFLLWAIIFDLRRRYWLAFAIAGLVYIMIGLAFTELASSYPVAGGGHYYALRGLGDVAGFLAGAALLLDYTIDIALFAVASTGYINFFPALLFVWRCLGAP